MQAVVGSGVSRRLLMGSLRGIFGRKKGLVEACVQFDGQSFVRLHNVAISLQERGHIFHDFLGRQEAVLIPPSSGSVLLSSLLTAYMSDIPLTDIITNSIYNL